VSTSVVKCSEGLSNRVSNFIRIYIYIYRLYEVCCIYGFFVYHIPSCSFGSIFLSLYIWLYVLFALV
jgi:cyanate lyase